MKLRTVLAGLALMAAGCGDDGDAGTSSLLPDTPLADTALTDTAGTGDADEDGTADAGPEPDAAPDADATEDVLEPDAAGDVEEPDAEPGQIEGAVLLSELDSPSFNVAGATARFTVAEEPPAPAGAFGPCVVRADDPAAPPPPGFGYDAGTLTVPGTTPPVTLTPVDQGARGTGYESSVPEDQEDLLPGGGALLTVSGAGGEDVGAFEAVVVAAEQVTVTSPSVGGFGASASTAEDLDVAWNVGTGEEVLVTLSPLSDGFQPEAGFAMVCTLPDDQGTFTVPKAALEMVRDGAGSRNTVLGVTRIRFGDADSGGVPVTIRATRSSGGLLKLTE